MDSVTPDPGQTFLGALQDLYRNAGYPAVRKIAAEAGGTISHTTVHQVTRGDYYPPWRTAKKIILALGGDPDELFPLWERDLPVGSGVSVLPPTGVPTELITALTANTEALDRLNAAVRMVLARLDGSPESAVALLADVPVDQLGEYGGLR